MTSALSLIVFGSVNFFNSAPPINQDAMQFQATLFNYTYFPGIGAYKVFTLWKTWDEARLACENEAGHMLIINSDAESKVITQLLVQFNIEDCWVGIHDSIKEGSFVTIHGDSLTKAGYDKWAPGEPNNVANVEHCGVVTKIGKLVDISCSTHRTYICELPRVQSSVLQVLGNAATLLPSNIVNPDAV